MPVACEVWLTFVSSFLRSVPGLRDLTIRLVEVGGDFVACIVS